jgi:hypothetical protein
MNLPETTKIRVDPVRFSCSMCKSRPTVNHIFSVVLLGTYGFYITHLVCLKCYEKVKTTSKWKPRLKGFHIKSHAAAIIKNETSKS